PPAPGPPPLRSHSPLPTPSPRSPIHSRDAVLPFLGLAACGLLAAALGSSRSRRARDLQAARRHLELLHATLGQLEAAGPVEPSPGPRLDALRKTLPGGAAGVRGRRNTMLAAPGQARRRPPTHV